MTLAFWLAAAGWAVALASAEVAVSSLARTVLAWRRGQDAEREPDQLMPGAVAAGGTVALILLGALPALPGAVTALALFAMGTWPLARHLREERDALSGGRAALAVVLAIAVQPAHVAARILDDARLLAALSRPGPAAGEPASPGPVTARPRREPSTARPHPDLGPAPVPEQVAAEFAGVAIPSAWAAVAERFAAFEPEDGEDLRLFIAENAAGILVVAEAIGGQAEDFAAGIKLDPVFTEAQVAFADDFADTASAAAMTLRAYDSAYGGVHEHVDGGGTLPDGDARGWFGVDGRAA